MTIDIEWDEFKHIAFSGRNMNVQYVEVRGFYHIVAGDGWFTLETSIPKRSDPDKSAEQIDFETNFITNCNKAVVSTVASTNQAFAAKALSDGSKIFRRVRGIAATINNSSENIDFEIPFTKCKITGVQILGASLGDKVTFQVLDTSQGTISGTPYAVLNTFGLDVYVVPDVANYPSRYDADLILGLTLRVVYDAVDVVLDPPRKIYINYDLHEIV